jgi:hypothetical protein
MTSDALRIKYSDPTDPWEELDTPWGRMPAWKAATYATGSAEAAIHAYQQVRNDSATITKRHDARERSLQARADALTARELKLRVDAAVVSELMGRVGKAIDWIERQKKRADVAEEPIPLPPGHKSEAPEPSLGQDTGELPGQEPGEDTAPAPASDETEFPDPTLPHPPVVQQPIAAGLDGAHGHDSKE